MDDEERVKAAKWDRICAMWNDPAADWDYDSRELMRELTGEGLGYGSVPAA